VRFTDPEVAPLIDGLRHEYTVRYGSSMAADDMEASEFDPPLGGFLVRRSNGVTVAGGGIRELFTGTAEIKRMWTHPDHRRQGHAIAVLHELEVWAESLGFAHVRLETGEAQPEALALYRRLGYREIGNYGHYPVAVGFERTFADSTEISELAPESFVAGATGR
jgi:GNAT superfamily N-acetyltransferase